MDDIFKNGINCIRCGHPLTVMDDDDDFVRYECTHCGIIYDAVAADKESRDNLSYWNDNIEEVNDEFHGYDGKCPICGHWLIVSGNFDRSEMIGDVDTTKLDEHGCYEDDTIVDDCVCPHCGTMLVVIPPKPSDESRYDYYKKI